MCYAIMESFLSLNDQFPHTQRAGIFPQLVWTIAPWHPASLYDGESAMQQDSGAKKRKEKKKSNNLKLTLEPEIWKHWEKQQPQDLKGWGLADARARNTWKKQVNCTQEVTASVLR